MEPSPASVLRLSLEYLLLPPRFLTGAAPGGRTPGHLQRTPPRTLLPHAG
ncbi:hypothetical protein JTE90_019021, partial [Oedothorax gibbosus]